MNIDTAVIKAASLLIEATRKEWKAQGKIASRRAFKTIQAKILRRFDVIVAGVYVEKYMLYQDRGVKPENIKIGRGLIEGLKGWMRFKMPHVPAKNRTNVAFAIANKMKKEGMPTRNAHKFSPSGRVLNWSTYVFNEVEPKIDILIDEASDGLVDTLLINTLRE